MACLDDATIIDWAAGRLDADARRTLHLHVDACPACYELLAELARAASPATSERSVEITAGRRIGRYLVLSRAGAGGMGEVFAAWDPDLGRRVALKIVRAFAGDSARQREHLLREARAAARVAHPNVVVVHDVGEAPDGVFVAMEFLDGGTLRGWLQIPRAWKAIAERFLAAGRGLAAAHQVGVVHRDFKPENVLLGGDGRVCVADFGLAQPSGHDSSRALETISASVTLVTGGTPAYMAPEQHAGEPGDAHSDQYAFCVALHEALWGMRPHAGDTIGALRQAVAQRRRVEVPSRPRLPRALVRLVERGLAFEPTARFETMAELLVALERCLRPRRRAWWLAGGLFVATVALVPALLPPSDACSVAPAWDGVWDVDRRETLRAAFTETKLGHADSTWARAKSSIDEHVAAIDASYRDACKALIAGGLSAAEYRERQQCLEDRRNELRVLLDVFAEPDRELVGRAIEAAMGLTPPSQCDEGVTLVASGGADRGREIAQVIEALQRVSALDVVGRRGEAQAEIEPLIATADATGDPAIIAQVALRRGQLQDEAGSFEEARASYVRASTFAMRAGDDLTAAKAWSRLYTLDSTGLELGERAEQWYELASAVLDRGEAPPDIAAHLAAQRADVMRFRGDLRGSAAAWEIAVERITVVRGPHHPDTAEARSARAKVLSMMGDQAMARTELEAALVDLRAAYGDAHRSTVGTLDSLGSVQAALGERDEAIASHERALELTAEVYGPEHPSMAHRLGNLGVVLDDGTDPRDSARALELQQRAVTILEATLGPSSVQTIGARHNVAGALSIRGRIDEAYRMEQEVMESLSAASLGEHPLAAKAHDSMARYLLELERPLEAQEHARRAVAIATAVYGAEHVRLVPPLVLEGIAGLDAGKPDLAPLERAWAIARGQDPPAPIAIDLRFTLARTLDALGQDPERVRELANEALTLALAQPSADPDAIRRFVAGLRERVPPRRR